MNKEIFSQENKNYELYKAAIEAFFVNELEHDKMLLNISVAAIGFYIALFSTGNFNVDKVTFFSVIFSLFFFLISAGCVLSIFYFNKKQLLEIIANPESSQEIKTLHLLDKCKYIPFFFGIFCGIIFFVNLIYLKIGAC